MPLIIAMPVTVVQPGFVKGPKRGYGRVPSPPPPPHGREMFEKSCMAMTFSPIKGRGHGPLAPLSYASDSVAARICQLGPKRGSEATASGRGGSASHGTL